MAAASLINLLLLSSLGDHSDVHTVSKRSASLISNDEMKRISADLWNMDENRIPDSKYEIYKDADKLFSWFDETELNHGTWPKFTVLLDNFNPQTGVTETCGSPCRLEEDNFIRAIMDTPLMQYLWEKLKEKDLASNKVNMFMDELKEYWFYQYSRANGKLDSSGFEHVFVGELKNGKVTGFHNWVQFYMEERDGLLEYGHHQNTCTPNTEKITFEWLDHEKPTSSMIVGTSPEFEIALYTLCFVARPNQVCTVSYGGSTRKIQTYDMSYLASHTRTVATAYPYC